MLKFKICYIPVIDYITFNKHQTFTIAIRNAQNKAQSVSKTLGLSMKAPLSVTEDSCELKICSGSNDDASI